MKKFLPKSIKNPQGFTLVELLVVISIIAVLAVTGFALYSNATAKGRDARRKTEVGAYAKALEMKYDAENNRYSDVIAEDFQSGSLPWVTTDISSAFSGAPVSGSNFKICAKLETEKDAAGAKEYCVGSSQGGAVPVAAAGVACPAGTLNANTVTDMNSATGLSCNANRASYSLGGVNVSAGGTIYVTCPSAGEANINILNSCKSNSAPYNSTWNSINNAYAAAAGGTSGTVIEVKNTGSRNYYFKLR